MPVNRRKEAKLWLMLVGVSKYQDDLLKELPYAVEDCKGLEQVFKQSSQRFPELKLIVHHSCSPEMPDLSTVRASLKQVVESAQSQDTVFFYFSGHGMLDESQQQAFLCLTDTQTKKLLDTGLRVQELLQMLGTCAARHQLIVLDACHSGGLTLRGVAPQLNLSAQIAEDLQQNQEKTQEFYALLSCDKKQTSWEFPELGHGVFTYYLIRGLRGEAADAKGEIEVKGLYKYIYHSTLQYIDKLNRRRRLINQQKCSRGETDALYSEYPLQTPKLIVEAVGELILGSKPAALVDSQPRRQALVVEGLSEGEATLALIKVLSDAGGFKPEYWHPDKRDLPDIREAVRDCLRCGNQEQATALLYLRGRIEETEAGEALLVLVNGVKLSRSWLRQQMRQSENAQQIVVLDCPGAKSLKDWVEDLRVESQYNQCLIVGAAKAENSEQFTIALRKTLEAANNSQAGFSVAEWIVKLEQELISTDVWRDFWLGNAEGVIEVLPARASLGQKSSSVDLGLCPYMGLRAFGEKDARYFYGRENLTQRLINELSQKSFLAVVGASGSGKSSVVQAGLMAQLRQGKHLPGSEQWLIKSFRPGENPMRALTLTLLRNPVSHPAQLELEGLLYLGGEGFVRWLRTQPYPIVVLVVDQFEELFTLASQSARQSFLDILMEALEYASDRFKLVITLRADFIANSLEIPKLAQKLQQSSVLVPPRLPADDYYQVIEKPAQKVELKVQPGLVEILLQDLHQSAADLPLLEFVLEQLWEHRDKQAGELTLQAYKEKIGGIKGALERQANAVYAHLTKEEKAVAEWIFLSLTHLAEGSEDTRRQVRQVDLFSGKYPDALVERTLQKFVAAKLIVVNQEGDESGLGQSRAADELSRELEVLKREVTIEVAHEILIRNWSTLRWWLDENRIRLHQQRLIEKKADEWKEKSKHPDFLLQRVQLASAEKFNQNYGDDLNPLAREYISASKRARRNTRIKTGGALTFSLSLILTSGIVAWQQRQQSQLANLIRYASFNIITPEIAQSISDSLPYLLETARASRQAGDVDKALDDYRQILSMTNKLQQRTPKNPEIPLILKTAENSLAQMIRQHRLPKLERELASGNFGKLVTPDFSLFENQYSGALKTSYAILMREAGAKADMNNDGYLTEGEEAALPCETLKDVQQLWRKYTNNRCGWYGACRELSGKSLSVKLFFPPAIPLLESRLQQCHIGG